MTKVSKSNPSLLRSYYTLTKPGIIYGNALTAAAGFFFASAGQINFFLFLSILSGSALVIASACVFNNYLDREIDSQMNRTKNRSLVTGEISNRSALTFATLLGILGFTVLIIFTNYLTAFIGLVGFVDYVLIYSFTKKTTSWATLIGSVAGATPIVAGYTAVSTNLDAAAIVLFLTMFFWQMPHFYAIAIYRTDEYKAAKIPTLPLLTSVFQTKLQILFFLMAYVASAAALTYLGYTGYVYLIAVSFVNLIWLFIDLKGFSTTNDKRWARQLFLFSLVVLLNLSAMLSISALLP